jgi:hypothetical protein
MTRPRQRWGKGVGASSSSGREGQEYTTKATQQSTKMMATARAVMKTTRATKRVRAARARAKRAMMKT